MTKLLYQQDAYLRSTPAEVVACEPEGNAYAVILDATVLSPEGGGQPPDHGTVGGTPVLALRYRGDGAVVHLLAGPVHGTVDVVLDWERRYDTMQQHTAEHLVTALALRRLGIRNTAFHLGAETGDIEFATPDLTPDQLGALEDAANDAIREGLPVRHLWVEPGAFHRMDVRSRGLPGDHTGPIRLVEIEGIDRNTCGGTHVASTAELQVIKLIGTEHLRGGTRVFFLAGGRVTRRLEEALAREKRLTDLLSCGPDQHVTVIAKLQGEVQALGNSLKKTRSEVAEQLCDALVQQGDVATLHRPGGTSEDLMPIAIAWQRRRPDGWALLTAGEREGMFILVGPDDRLRQTGAEVAAILEGRGGGSRGIFRGKAGSFSRREEALARVHAAAAAG